MWTCSLFLLFFVSFGGSQGSDCLTETLKCSRLRPVLQTHRNLLDSPTQLNEMCSQYARFYKCLDDLVSSRLTREANLPQSLQHARNLIQDLCFNTSLQSKYFHLASCINKQYTEFCTSLEFLGTALLDGKAHTKCSLREEAVNCVAATLAMHCGMEAGKLFHHLLDMTSDGDENCYAVGSDILFLPMAPESDKLEVYTNVYSSLVKRIGNIPEQEESSRDPHPLAAEEFTEDYLVSSSLATEQDDESSISNDSLLPPHIFAQKLYQAESFDELKELIRNRNRKVPFVVRFHSNSSFSEYSYDSFLNYVEFLHCFRDIQDGKVKYVCSIALRTIVPICKEGGRKPQDKIPIIPEDIDPELGAKLYAMVPYAYHFKPIEEVYDSVYKPFFGPSNSSAEPFHTTTADSLSSEGFSTERIRDLYVSAHEGKVKDSESQVLNDQNESESKESYSHTDYVSEGPSLDLRYHIMAVTTLSPQSLIEERADLSVDESIFGTKYLTREQMNLYMDQKEMDRFIEQFRDPSKLNVQYANPYAAFFTLAGSDDSRLFNFTCGRVNECHPNATGIFKCTLHFLPEIQIADKSNTETPHMESTTEKEITTTFDVSMTNENAGTLGKERGIKLPTTETEFEPSRLNLDFSEDVTEMSELVTEPVHMLLLEPSNLPLSNAEGFRVMEADVDDEAGYASLKLNEDPTLDESDDIDLENLRLNLALSSLNDIENIIARGLDNIYVE